MVKRLGAFSVLTLVALAATGVAPAAAGNGISVDRAKQAIRTTLHADFEGGIEKGSLTLAPCARDGIAVRCRINLADTRGRTWCGRGSAWPGEASGDLTRTVTRFHVHRVRCGA